jgi:hypothetical protein
MQYTIFNDEHNFFYNFKMTFKSKNVQKCMLVI